MAQSKIDDLFFYRSLEYEFQSYLYGLLLESTVKIRLVVNP